MPRHNSFGLSMYSENSSGRTSDAVDSDSDCDSGCDSDCDPDHDCDGGDESHVACERSDTVAELHGGFR